jgi:hypothetical protein
MLYFKAVPYNDVSKFASLQSGFVSLCAEIQQRGMYVTGAPASNVERRASKLLTLLIH